jgi:DUF1365 family protein
MEFTAMNARLPAEDLLMSGRVMHERLRPVRNRFVYPVFCVRLNLARLMTTERWWLRINRFGPLSLYLRDYGPCDGSDLRVWLLNLLAQSGIAIDGDIWLQTFPRVFGFAFNPVSFWYCHDRTGGLRALLAEVRNTFGARHCYLLHPADNAPIGSATVLPCQKVLHVSPFCRVEGHYMFRVRESERGSSIAIDYHDPQGLVIRTAIALRKQPLTGASAMRALVRQPWLTLAVVARIHWQAIRLWIRRTPYHGSNPAPPAVASASRSREQEQR